MKKIKEKIEIDINQRLSLYNLTSSNITSLKLNLFGNSFVEEFLSILSKPEIKGESMYDSNYFKINSNYEDLRDKLDKYYSDKKGS